MRLVDPLLALRLADLDIGERQLVAVEQLRHLGRRGQRLALGATVVDGLGPQRLNAAPELIERRRVRGRHGRTTGVVRFLRKCRYSAKATPIASPGSAEANGEGRNPHLAAAEVTRRAATGIQAVCEYEARDPTTMGVTIKPSRPKPKILTVSPSISQPPAPSLPRNACGASRSEDRPLRGLSIRAPSRRGRGHSCDWSGADCG